MQVYFDNAATTAVDTSVIQRMTDVMNRVYGNPSAIHAMGRSARAEIELARKSIAQWLHCKSNEIYFTGSGTEADNMALRCAVNDLGVKHIISSPIEHKAVLDTAKDLQSKGLIELHLLEPDSLGRVRYEELEILAANYPGALISLMHANNELGTLHDLSLISAIARKNNCYFHSDTVQTMGHYAFNLEQLDIDFITCSAHKFHGPKGVGFLYKNKALKLKPIITGGGQESKLRAGTENVTGIVGLACALDVAYESLEKDKQHIQSIKNYMMEELQKNVPGLYFNGDTSNEGGLYTVLNVSLPPSDNASTLLYQLDMEGLCVSGGSACNSGALGESHVLSGIRHPSDRSAIRFSFSKYNKQEEVDYSIALLSKVLQPVSVM